MKKRGLSLSLLFLLLVPTFALSAEFEKKSESRLGITAALGVPHPLSAELEASLSSAFNLGLGGGYFSYTFPQAVDANIQNYEAKVRWFVFGGSFFLGAGLGSHRIKASKTEVISASGVSVSTKVEASISAKYLTPQLGWFKVTDSGFVFGLELGALLPFSANTEIKATPDDPGLAGAMSAVTTTPQYQSLESDVKDKGNKIGKTTLPYLTLIRLGWMF